MKPQTIIIISIIVLTLLMASIPPPTEITPCDNIMPPNCENISEKQCNKMFKVIEKDYAKCVKEMKHE